MQSLDYPHFFVYDAKGLGTIVRAWKHCPKVNFIVYGNREKEEDLLKRFRVLNHFLQTSFSANGEISKVNLVHFIKW